MHKARLKAYAPQARRDFMQMIRQRADLLGLTKAQISPARIEGDFAIIEGRPYPRNYAASHAKQSEKIKTEGIEQFISRIAYLWFNRFAALRFMEINGFFSHGFRVLSNREAGKDEPEILTHAAEIDLPGLDKSKVLELKLAGNKDAELYRMLLIAQCNELHRAMPFLFEKVGGDSEILLPDNLLATDSVIRKMVGELDEDHWRDPETEEPIVEVIGWLYQFYISEKKDEVIGKTVKSEDIPAATQLFTPNWIVKYMTQNSLGRLWLEANPHSALAQNMEFYIEPSEESSNPKSEIRNPKSAITPEEIRVLDPACGSGHILVEAYELLKAIYTERGYRSRDIPLLILEKNLVGLDIDERASQMASFALLMKARRDDRRIFEKINALNDTQIQNPKSKIPNVIAVPDSSHLKTDEIAEMFFSNEEQANEPVPSRDNSFLFGAMETQPSATLAAAEQSKIQNLKSKIEVSETNISDLLNLFEHGKTLGSLIRIPPGFGAVVEKLEKAVEAKLRSGNFLEQIAARELEPFVRAGCLLANKYDCVIANPPYMGGKGMNAELKAFAAKNFPDSKSDLFAMFIERNLEFANESGQLGFMSPFVWMFISTYEKIREMLIDKATITTLIQLEYSGFAEAVVPICTFTLARKNTPDAIGSFIRLSDFKGHQNQAPKTLEAIQNPECGWFFNAKPYDFKKIPGSPIAYWASRKAREIFEKDLSLYDIAPTRQGLATGDNNRFLKHWFEVGFNSITFKAENAEQAKTSRSKWFPCNKGGAFRKWYGNNDFVVNWANDGEELKRFEGSVIRNPSYYFREGITWSSISSSDASFRYSPQGRISESKGAMAFVKDSKQLDNVLGFLNTPVVKYFLKIFSPTLDFHEGPVGKLPINFDDSIKTGTEEAVSIARADWDSFETSWDFASLPLLQRQKEKGKRQNSVEEAWNEWKQLTEERIQRMQQLETENNRLFIEAYGLADELSPEVPLEQITLARADAEKDTRRLLSYFIGCLMGRYSLDEEGLIYADAGGKGFDPSRYLSFPADDDGIVPVTDVEWFPTDSARRFAEFIRVAFRDEGRRMRDEKEENESPSSFIPHPSSFEANLRWIADRLGAKAGETPIETVRRYFSTSFFKDHLQTYKKRPLYWLFSSGKQKAFEALVYLHRYSEATLPRMRHEYVLPLMGKLTAQIENLERARGGAQTSSERTKIEKQLEAFRRKQIELAQFDDKLRHYSDMRIALDLDDGVKVNYGKFGDLLAEVKQVAATKE